LLSQNQFNAEGMSGLLDDQIREAAKLAAGKTVYATPENLRKIAERNNEIAMGFGAQPTVAVQPSAPKDDYVVGMEYKDGKGGKAIYLGNGKWKEK